MVVRCFGGEGGTWWGGCGHPFASSLKNVSLFISITLHLDLIKDLLYSLHVRKNAPFGIFLREDIQTWMLASRTQL